MRSTMMLALPFAVWPLLWFGCGSSGSAGAPEAGADGSLGADAGGDGGGMDSPVVPPPDGAVERCQLFDGTDPVALCLQKIVLGNQLLGAYAKGRGVAPAWDAITGAAGAGHSWRDDVGFAASVGSFHCSAVAYGDTQLAPRLDAVLPDLGATIAAELTSAPSGYDGEDYFRLQAASTGFDYANDTSDSATVAGLAEAFGRNLQTVYAQTVTWIPTAGGAGTDGGDAGLGGEASADDAGTVEAAAPPGVTSTILGSPDGQGHVVYAPAQALMGAAALLDLAVRHAGEPDAGADVATWTATAVSTADYVWARGRDPVTGLFYERVVTNDLPGHDTPASTDPRGVDVLLADVQGEAVLALARLQDAYGTLQTGDDAGLDASAVVAQSRFAREALALGQALVDGGLFDGTMTPPPAPPAGAFLEALLPATGAVEPNLTTTSNAWILGGLHRAALTEPTHTSDIVLGQLHAALTQQVPAHSSLFTVVVDPKSGSLIQTDYLRAASSAFGYATTFGVDAGDGGPGTPEPGATSYRSDAIAATIEALTQLWRTRGGSTVCGP